MYLRCKQEHQNSVHSMSWQQSIYSIWRFILETFLLSHMIIKGKVQFIKRSPEWIRLIYNFSPPNFSKATMTKNLWGGKNFYIFSSNVLLSLGKLNNRSIDLKIFRIWNWIFEEVSEKFSHWNSCPQGWKEEKTRSARHLENFSFTIVKCKSIFVQENVNGWRANKNREIAFIGVTFVGECMKEVWRMEVEN